MKQLTTLTILLLFCINLFTQSEYARVRIMLHNTELSEIAALGIDINEGVLKKGAFFETDLSSRDIRKLQNENITHEIVIRNVSSFYAERAAGEKNLDVIRDTDDEWIVPENWEYGSMGGFYTLDEIYAELDDMFDLYPELITERVAISEDTLTHEGRKQYWVKISDNPGTDEDEPELLYTAVHHAREAISPQQTLFYMWYLLENYDSDEEIKHIVDNTEMYFIPVINPDGYAYNELTDPNGGGMWRKNRRDNGDGSFGVDPNRNYGYFWGLNNEGSSPYPSDDTYRGPAPFSEPENKNMRDFCNAHEFLIALNYHSYSNLLLSPWGYTEDLPPDNDLLIAYAELMTRENNYTYGPGSTTIYPTNGGSDDWMYGEQEMKDMILSYTPEVGSGNDGFWPGISRIIPLCQEQMWQNITAARLVGHYGVAKNLSDMVTDQIENHAVFSITRLGLAETETFSVTIEALDDHIIDVDEPVEFENMELLETNIDSINYLLDASIENGTVFKYLLTIDDGTFSVSDTVTKIYGTELLIFEDDCETLDNWNSTEWDVTNEDSYSPDFSITDSPYGSYQHNQNSSLVLDTTFNLSGASAAFLRFHAKWDIEEGYDYVQLLARETGSGNWIPLQGRYSSFGNYYLGQDEPVYDGEQDEWIEEEISLMEFVNKEIELFFRFYSDSYVRGDGFYFDDMQLSVISTATHVDQIDVESLIISDVYPNPVVNIFRVQYKLNQHQQAEFQLFDLSGQELRSITISGHSGILSVNIQDLPQGIYHYRIKNNTKVSKTGKLIKL